MHDLFSKEKILQSYARDVSCPIWLHCICFLLQYSENLGKVLSVCFAGYTVEKQCLLQLHCARKPSANENIINTKYKRRSADAIL